MKLRDDANEYKSLYHLALRWARSDTTNFPYSEFIQSFNVAINKLAALIERYDADWPWLDRNETGELIEKINLVSGTNSYDIQAQWLKISRVRILLDDGQTWKTLKKTSRQSISDEQLSTSITDYYYLLGNKLYLEGTPIHSKTNGIEIQYQQGPKSFTPTDEDEEVGFGVLFEELAALMPALDYLDINGTDEAQAERVRQRIGQEPRQGVEGSGLLGALVSSYLERNDAPQTISLKKSPRALGLQSSGGNYNPPY